MNEVSSVLWIGSNMSQRVAAVDVHDMLVVAVIVSTRLMETCEVVLLNHRN